MSIHLAICHLFLGSFTAAENAIKQARHVLERQLDSGPAYTAIAHVVDALLLYERNELAAAASAAHLGLAGLEHAEGCFEQYLISTYVAATVAFSTSGMETAMRVIERGRRLARYHGLTRLEDLLDCLSARLLINAGHWESATSLASTSATLRSVSTDTGWIELDFATPVRAQIELFSGRIEEARTFAAAMIVRSRASGRVPAEIRAHLLMAIACAADDTQGDVRTSLRHALELATAETIVQPFFEFDERLLRLLRDFQRTDLITLPAPQANFLSGLVLRMIAAGKAKNNKEPLTAREREILTHLTQGSSNKAIARALDLTENAVKFHLKNIFRKLGVESRAMAAAVAERMSLESTLAARPTAPASKAHH